jgi:RNA polymerase sigma-70 factor, ECF subfamily
MRAAYTGSSRLVVSDVLMTATARDQTSVSDPKRIYEDVLQRAFRYAERLVPREQAFEIAHDVAVEMLRRPPARMSGTMLYLRVTSRLRNAWRASQRRAATDRAYLDMRGTRTPAWADPAAGIEAEELRACIREALNAMPRGMREIFLLVRDEELSYKQAAARLGVSVGTVHTQLSRANALLRERVLRYQAGTGT